jgi:hypothetical protein
VADVLPFPQTGTPGLGGQSQLWNDATGALVTYNMILHKSSHTLFRVGEMPTSRIEAFSDGVFAIIITLLVLEIHVPQVQGKDVSAALAQSLLRMAPKFLDLHTEFCARLHLVGCTPSSLPCSQAI